MQPCKLQEGGDAHVLLPTQHQTGWLDDMSGSPMEHRERRAEQRPEKKGMGKRYGERRTGEGKGGEEGREGKG